MATDGGITDLVLQEFRLARADTDGAVARIVSSLPSGAEPAVPLLVSIEDRRNVAIIRALHTDESNAADVAQRTALDPSVASWNEPTKYSPRISERSQSQPASYRLAVTESGINDAGPEVVPLPGEYDAPPSRLGLLWVGDPIGTHAGLLVLVGNDDDPSTPRAPARQWPLPLSKFLGVRIYEGG